MRKRSCTILPFFHLATATCSRWTDTPPVVTKSLVDLHKGYVVADAGRGDGEPFPFFDAIHELLFAFDVGGQSSAGGLALSCITVSLS